MEDFSNAELDTEDIDEAFAQLSSYILPRWQVFLNWFSRRRRHRHHKWLAEARSELKARKHRYQRQGTERCLKCGHQSATPFEGVINTSLTIDGVLERRNPTGVLHPGCGGELFAEGGGMRFSVRLATRVLPRRDLPHEGVNARTESFCYPLH